MLALLETSWGERDGKIRLECAQWESSFISKGLEFEPGASTTELGTVRRSALGRDKEKVPVLSGCRESSQCRQQDTLHDCNDQRMFLGELELKRVKAK